MIGVRQLLRNEDAGKVKTLNDVLLGIYLRLEAAETAALPAGANAAIEEQIAAAASGTNTGDVTLAVVGAASNNNAATLVGQVLNLEAANASHPGVVSVGTQSFAGAKTFTGAISASNLSGTNTGDVTLAAVGAVPNANGATLTGQMLNLQPASAAQPGVVTTGVQSLAGAKTFTGAISASNLSGTNTGDVTIGTANGLSLAAQALSLATAIAGGANGALLGTDKTKLDNLSNTNTGDVTLAAVGAVPNANGATLTGQALNLQPADATLPGVLTAGTQTIGGAKTFNAELSGPAAGLVKVNGVTASSPSGNNAYRMLDGAYVNFSTADTNASMYRSAVDTLRTPAALVVDDYLSVGDAQLDTSVATVAAARNGVMQRGLLKIVLPYTEFDAAGMLNSVAIANLPAKTRVVSAFVDVTTAFNTPAGATAIKVSLGFTADAPALIVATSCAVTGVLGDADAELGTNFVRAAAIQGGYMPSWTAITQMLATVELTTGGSLANLTQGSITVYVITERMD